MIKVSFLCLVVLVIGCSVFNPALRSEALKKGEQARLSRDFQKAYKHYKQHLSIFPDDHRGLSGLGITLFHLDSLERAISVFEKTVDGDGKTSHETYYFYARALHLSDHFDKADEAYITFLQKAPKTEQRRKEVAGHIWQVKNGKRLSRISSRDFVIINPGESVNTSNNEIIPIQSSSDVNRYYFSSDRSDTLIQLSAPYRFFQTSVKDGFWAGVELFQPHAPTVSDEVLNAISPSGELLLFTRVEEGKVRFYADSFSRSEKAVLFRNFPANPAQGDRDVYFITDSLALFSSMRPGGFGGYDLYITKLSHKGWSVPENLGPVINSARDELSPFLAIDGRHLYFSSNRYESIGGYDVFRAAYSDNTKRWTTPTNLGYGINSGADDLFFKLDRTGQRAVLSSNRPGGYGGMDIFTVVYRQTVTEQMVYNEPETFYELDHFSPLFESASSPAEKTDEASPQPIKVEIITVYLDQEETTIPDSVKAVLDKFVATLKPNDQVELRGHCQSIGDRAFDAFTSFSKADEVSSYLQKKGLTPEQIVVKGFGSQYIKLNNGLANLARVDILVHPSSDEGVEVLQLKNKDPLTPFYDKLEGVSFSVQFVSLSQMYTGDLFEKIKDGFIHRAGLSRVLQYNIGIEAQLSEILVLRNTIRRETPFKDAFINAYLNGIKLPRASINNELKEKYPELKKFMLLTE